MKVVVVLSMLLLELSAPGFVAEARGAEEPPCRGDEAATRYAAELAARVSALEAELAKESEARLAERRDAAAIADEAKRQAESQSRTLSEELKERTLALEKAMRDGALLEASEMAARRSLEAADGRERVLTAALARSKVDLAAKEQRLRMIAAGLETARLRRARPAAMRNREGTAVGEAAPKTVDAGNQGPLAETKIVDGTEARPRGEGVDAAPGTPSASSDLAAGAERSSGEQPKSDSTTDSSPPTAAERARKANPIRTSVRHSAPSAADGRPDGQAELAAALARRDEIERALERAKDAPADPDSPRQAADLTRELRDVEREIRRLSAEISWKASLREP